MSEVQLVTEARTEADRLLKNSAEFDKVFEEIFVTFDKNKDKKITMEEYANFLNAMLSSSGKRKYDLSVAMLKFERADKDSDGNISKEEFKKEVLKRLREFAITK